MKQSKMKKIMTSELGVILVLLLLCVIVSLFTPMFMTSRNLLNVLRRTATTGIVAIGMTFVIGTGNIDLSVSGQVTIIGVLAAWAFNNTQLPPALIILGMFVLGALFGLFNGVCVTILKIPAIMVTLALQLMTNGYALYLTNGRTFTINVAGYDRIGLGAFLGVPIPIWIFLLAIIVGLLLMKKFTIGRKILATGSNAKGAWYAGINTTATTITAFVFAGLASALSSLILSSKLSSAASTLGDGMEMDAIAAVVIGGTSLNGGSGYVIGTVAGALIIEAITNWMTLANVNSYLREVVKGAIILVALLVDNLRRNRLKKNDFEG